MCYNIGMNRKVGRNLMYIDYHVHTEFSDDSVYLMEDIVKDAIAKGIKEICFTAFLRLVVIMIC